LQYNIIGLSIGLLAVGVSVVRLMPRLFLPGCFIAATDGDDMRSAALPLEARENDRLNPALLAPGNGMSVPKKPAV
jgi:hypothetical protein